MGAYKTVAFSIEEGYSDILDEVDKQKEEFKEIIKELEFKVTQNVKFDIDNINEIRILIQQMHQKIEKKQVPNKYAIRLIAKSNATLSKIE